MSRVGRRSEDRWVFRFASIEVVGQLGFIEDCTGQVGSFQKTRGDRALFEHGVERVDEAEATSVDLAAQPVGILDARLVETDVVQCGVTERTASDFRLPEVGTRELACHERA